MTEINNTYLKDCSEYNNVSLTCEVNTSDLLEQLVKEFAKTFGILFESRITLQDSTLSNKEKLVLIEKYLCDLDKNISSIFCIIKDN